MEVQDDQNDSTVASSLETTNMKCSIKLIKFEINSEISSDYSSENEGENIFDCEDSTKCSYDNSSSENDDII